MTRYSLKLAVAALALACGVGAHAQDKFTVQLKWVPQARASAAAANLREERVIAKLLVGLSGGGKRNRHAVIASAPKGARTPSGAPA